MKKKTRIALEVLSVVLILGVLLLAFRFNQEFKIQHEDMPKEEIPKLKIMDLESKTRPIAVMINNLGPARNYHSGLQEAYLIYEMIVEGGITRLMAVYKDVDVSKIGSIRSARPYYLDYVLENDALFVHWGYSEQALSDIRLLGISNLDGYYYEKSYFWRDKSLPIASEHRGFTNIENINKGIEALNYRKTSQSKPLLNYSVEPVALDQNEKALSAREIDIGYSKSVTTHYSYDEETKMYKRSVNQQPHTDYVSKNQYVFKNIITYQVPNENISGDVKGRQILKNIGKGEGYYISEGYAIPIQWEKRTRESKTIYRLLNGEELKVNDGNTFIQIQPTGEVLSIT